MQPYYIRCTYTCVSAIGSVILRFNTPQSKLHLIMPKNYSHHEALKEQRLARKQKLQKYIPGTVKLYVLGSGSKGSPKSLYLFTGVNSYLFNCGEGVQRLANEHKRKLSKLEHVFITRPAWSNIGGLPGLALTVQDVGLPKITLHGPDGLDMIVPATRRFIVLNHLSVEVANCSRFGEFEDNILKIKYVSLPAGDSVFNEADLKSSNQAEPPILMEDDTDYYGHERSPQSEKSNSHDNSKSENALKRKDIAQASHQEAKKMKTSSGSITMAFICQLNPKPGVLNVKKCVERNVPVGPLLGFLKAGKNVTLPSGEIVKAEEVKGPDDPGPIIIVVDCPTVAFVDSLINESSFEKYQKNGDKDDIAYLVAHFSPPEVMKDPRYESWMRKFSPTTKHLLLNESNHCMGSTAVHEVQQKLNLFDANVFPLLKDTMIRLDHSENEDGSNSSNGHIPNPRLNENIDSETVIDGSSNDDSNTINVSHSEGLSELSKAQVMNSESLSIVQGRTLLCAELRPTLNVDTEFCPVLTPEKYLEEAFSIDGFKEKLDEFHENLKSLPTDSRDYPRVLFLGTGSSVPNKIRNTSGILLEINAEACMLLDCGEGTYSQLVRFFGESDSDRILSKLKAIYVSHLHADHHLGLIGLLQARRKALPKENFSPIFLIAPHQIMSWMTLYHYNFEPVLSDFTLIPNVDLSPTNGCSEMSEERKALLETFGLTLIQTIGVKHCVHSFGVSLTHSSGWKMTYSGDTMPCDSLVQIGMNSDLLIHEATMEDELSGEALIKMHSTTSQAIDIGRKMKAKFTLLTHFSQRYAKIPNLTNHYEDVGVAFDNMQVRLSDLKKLPLMIPALQVLFGEYLEEMKQKSRKRQLREEKRYSN